MFIVVLESALMLNQRGVLLDRVNDQILSNAT